MDRVYTTAEFAAAFTEWERRYREEPARFQSEASKLLKDTPQSYGQACAPYFVKILNDLSSATSPLPAMKPAAA